jgi:hypothetical protein
VTLVDIKEMWDADQKRTDAVRALSDGLALDKALADAFGDASGEWWDASTMREVAMAAVRRLQARHPDRVDAFAQRLLDEVAPWATAFGSAIELNTYEMPPQVGEGGPHTVMCILTATPADIVRAIILALPER